MKYCDNYLLSFRFRCLLWKIFNKQPFFMQMNETTEEEDENEARRGNAVSG